MRAGKSGMIGILFAISLHCAAAETGAPAEFADLVYATTPERDLCVDIFVPSDIPRPPLVLYIHGGGWKNGSRKTPFVRPLAAQG
ncbi:MAG: Carboxylesterase NlhH, partial [Verrucomicrobiota bacterium]